MLKNIDDKTAQWYYLSAVANMGLGRQSLALSYIQQACAMEPDNFVYTMAYSKIRNQANNSYRRSTYTSTDNSTVTDEPTKENRGCLGCLGTILKIVFIISLFQLIVSIIFSFAGRNSRTKARKETTTSSSYTENNNDNSAEYILGSDDGSETFIY